MAALPTISGAIPFKALRSVAYRACRTPGSRVSCRKFVRYGDLARAHSIETSGCSG